MSGRLEGRVAAITDASSGIGRASARLFAAEGARLVLFDKTDAVEETAAMVESAGGRALAMVGDAGEESDVAALVAQATDSFGALHVMFANAGISGGMANIFDTDVALITEVLRVNLIGPFLAIKHAAPKIAERGGGAIVLTASVAGIRSGAGSGQPRAAKTFATANCFRRKSFSKTSSCSTTGSCERSCCTSATPTPTAMFSYGCPSNAFSSAAMPA